jgi:hypothetical protein
MGLSFHDDTTIIDSSAVTTSEMRFSPGDTNSTLEVGKVVHQEPESECDIIDVQGGNSIEETER